MRLGLVARLVLTVALFLIPAGAWIGFTANRERELATQEIEDRLDLHLAEVVAGVEHHLLVARQTLQILAEVPEVHADPATCSAFLDGIRGLNPDLPVFARADLNGRVDCSAPHLAGPIEVGDRNYFQRALLTEDFTVGQFRNERFAGYPAVTKAYPLHDGDGNLSGLIMTASTVETFLRFDGVQELPTGSVVTVVDPQGVVIARSEEPERFVGETILDEAILRQARTGAVYQAVGIDGVERLYVAGPLGVGDPAVEVLVIAGIPVAAVVAPVIAETLRALIFVLGLLVLIGTAVAVAVHLVVLRPVGRMADAATQIQAGDLDVRIGPPITTRNDEIGALALTFDETADQLVHHIHELEQANERLGELDRIKAWIIDTVAHELRTPLVTLNLQVALLDKRLADRDDPKTRSALVMVERNVRRLDRLVQSLITVAKIQAGQADVALEEVPLEPVLARLEADWDSRAENEGLTLRIERPPVRVVAGPKVLDEILEELMDNAFKFTPKGGNVTVTVDPQDQEVVVVVADTGIGIDLSEGVPTAPLEPRGGPVRGGRIGVGVGLFVARARAETLNGSLDLESEGPGRGTRAVLRLPRAAPTDKD